MKERDSGRARHLASRLNRRLVMSFVFALLLLSGASLYAYEQGTPVASVQLMNPSERTQIERLLSEELQRVANRKAWFEGQTHPIHVAATFDLRTGGVLIDIGAQYGPMSATAEMEDLQGELSETTRQLLTNIAPFKGIELIFGGRDMYYFHPEQWRAPRPLPLRQGTQGSIDTRFYIDPIIGPKILDSTVVISAGHGIYYHYGYRDWRPQRDPSNGITEDFITPLYATELKAWMDQRGAKAALFPRAIPATIHAPSGRPWWQIGARYNLEALYPDYPEVWHSEPSLTTELRERTEDIESRPLYANLIGADSLLSIHTNAADPSASGTRVFHQSGRPADQALGNNVLCYMAELIHSNAKYTNFPVATTSTPENYAENRLSQAPAIIIEVGFHTNQNDAWALQDPTFRTAAMKGVEKGYRLYTQGRSCEPFAITSIPEASAPIGTPFKLDVWFKGYPQFPIKRSSVFVSCPSGWTCTDTEEIIAAQATGPIPTTRLCTAPAGKPTTSFGLRTTLTDADGVSTSMEHRYTCTGGQQSSSSTAMTGGL